MHTSYLDALTSPLGGRVFLRDFWPGLPFVQHGPLDRFNAPFEKLSRIAPTELLATVERPVIVYGPWASSQSGGLFDRIAIHPRSASELSRAQSVTIEIDHYEIETPSLQTCLRELRQELELPTGAMAKAVWLFSSNESGLAPHFDAYANFVIQLRGEKLWRLSPNRCAECPMEHFELEDQLPSSELSSYWRGPVPPIMPGPVQEVSLRPGSVLFLPRGYWHSTVSGAESLSINLTFSQPTWLDLLLVAIRGRLVAQSRWRELAIGVEALDPRHRQEAISHLHKLLEDLQLEIATLQPDELAQRATQEFDLVDAYKAAIATRSKLRL
jgi:50S ribosomal protein L16 3-hydroxylase